MLLRAIHLHNSLILGTKFLPIWNYSVSVILVAFAEIIPPVGRPPFSYDLDLCIAYSCQDVMGRASVTHSELADELRI